MRILKQASATMMLLLISSSAFAHAVDGKGFYAGLSHPVGGLDHLIAMLSVGILSTQLGSKHIWYAPLTFVSFMTIGGITGFAGIDIPMRGIEFSIMFSVILLGLSIALTKKLPLLITYLFVGYFGFSHGYAHGVELPVQALPIYFASGFLISTILIHIGGVLIGFTYLKVLPQGKMLLRFTGAVFLGMGLQMLIQNYL